MNKRSFTSKRQAQNTKEKNEKEKNEGQNEEVTNNLLILPIDGQSNVGKTIPTEKGNFYFQQQKFLLTYAGHVNKEKFHSWFVSLFGGKTVKEVHIAHETGLKGGKPYPHSHVLVDLGFRHQTRNSRFFDYLKIHPHIKKVTTKAHWNNLLKYLSKEDKECAYLLELLPTSAYNSIIGSGTLEEAIENNLTNPNDVFGIKELYRMKRNKTGEKVYIDVEDYLDWQKIFFKVSYNQGGADRTINWLYDKRGGAGKTHFAHHLCDNFGTDWCLLHYTGNQRDFLHNVGLAIEGGWGGYGMIVDVPRSQHLGEDFYSTLELCIDGRLTLSKYGGGSVIIGKPHLWVFSNIMPSVSTMSLDRWRIIKTGKGGKGVALLVYDNYGNFLPTNCCHGVVGYSFVRSSMEASSSSGGLFFDASLSLSE
ncbi:MAG: hypothetical protein GY777_29840 [Candidatus Brocadiaceae bacterium]|nr:hypothetical protein [Candidatus Brocadiaceae bacterium]